MIYSIVFDPKAMDFLEKLPRQIRIRIFDKVISAKKDPFHFFERLEGRTDYKMRVGAYRVIADINKAKKEIEVNVIGHRKNIYRKII